METDVPHKARNASQISRARQGNGGTPKLRASCDHCSSAKVRCGQGRPSCQRCLYLSIPCNYSASRRMGRTSNGKNGKPKTRTSPRGSCKETSYCSDTASESSDSPKNNMQQTSDSGLGSYERDFGYADSQPWNDAGFMTGLSNSPNFASFSNHHANTSNLGQPQMAETQLRATLPDFDQLDFAAPFQKNATQNPNRMAAEQSRFEQLFPDLFTSPNTISDPASSIAHPSTSCVELASSTLQSLSLPSSMCTSSPHPIPLQTVEQVLAISRGGISAFNQILECQCSHSSSFTLTLALMISKILDCYSAICRCSTSLPMSDDLLPTSSPATTTIRGNNRKVPLSRDLPISSTSSASLSTLSSPAGTSTPRGPHNIVMDTPIAIGEYKIDADDENPFILQLLLTELRKVGKLVDAFAVQFSAPHSINGRSDRGENLVHKPLERFLRCHVNEARREVDTVLRRSEVGG